MHERKKYPGCVTGFGVTALFKMSAKYVTFENGDTQRANLSIASTSRTRKDQKESENRFKVHIYENYEPNVIVETSEDDDESERVQINRCVPKAMGDMNGATLTASQNDNDDELYGDGDNFNVGYGQFLMRNRKQFSSISGGRCTFSIFSF